MALFRHVTMDDRLAAAGQQHPCMDRSSQLNAYAALTGGLDLARSVHYLALSARLIEPAPAASAGQARTLAASARPDARLFPGIEA
ncbi:hypothetical protein [Stenotrophomonas maltophilia]|uniref:hypothetical protein n=1 Tax=Stenotrophomonas maltophilia TaxID=40324 RepID=UPI003BF7BE32